MNDISEQIHMKAHPSVSTPYIEQVYYNNIKNELSYLAYWLGNTKQFNESNEPIIFVTIIVNINGQLVSVLK